MRSKFEWSGCFWGGLAFLVSAWIAYSCAAYYGSPLLEAGDSAANSLLVLGAKKFDLFFGNYSRLGFNHPGPALIYVLAFGEWIFFDVLKLASSPIVGQAMGCSLYVGFWLGVVGWAFERIFERRILGVSGAFVFFAILAAHDPLIFGSMWFPYLYMLPFAAFLLSSALIVHGDYSAFRFWCLALGVLVHGHASFIVICGLMAIGVLSARYVVGRISVKDVFFELIFKNRRDFYIGLVVVLVFLVPIFINTAINFPGEFPKYFTYGSKSIAHGVYESLGFVSASWGGGAGAAVVVAVTLFCIGLRVRGRGYLIGFFASICIASLVVVFYVVRGVDDLSPGNSYTILFFYTVFALILSSGLVVAVGDVMPGRSVQNALLLLLIFASIGCFFWRFEVAPIHSMPEISDVSNYLLSDGEGGVVLDLDNAEGWGETWSGTAGVAVLLSRKGGFDFCINKSWHVLFTKKLRCSNKQYGEGRHYEIGSSSGRVGKLHGARIFGTLAVAPVPVKYVGRGSGWKVSVEGADALVSGWTAVEENGDYVWSVGPSASLVFWIRDLRLKKMILDASAFLPHADSVQRFRVFIGKNGIPAGEIEIKSGAVGRAVVVDLPDGSVEDGGRLFVEFKIDSPISPKASGLSGDDRSLGILLRGITFE